VNYSRRSSRRLEVVCSIGNESVADTTGTVLVAWDGHFLQRLQRYNVNIFFAKTYTEAILPNSTRKLLWFEITEMLIEKFILALEVDSPVNSSSVPVPTVSAHFF